MADVPRKYAWLDVVCSPNGPSDPIDRLILMCIAKTMRADGSRAHPSHQQLADMAGFATRRTILRRLSRLSSEWVEVINRQRGKTPLYVPLVPEAVTGGVTPRSHRGCDTQESHVSVLHISPRDGGRSLPVGAAPSPSLRPLSPQLEIPAFALRPIVAGGYAADIEAAEELVRKGMLR